MQSSKLFNSVICLSMRVLNTLSEHSQWYRILFTTRIQIWLFLPVILFHPMLLIPIRADLRLLLNFSRLKDSLGSQLVVVLVTIDLDKKNCRLIKNKEVKDLTLVSLATVEKVATTQVKILVLSQQEFQLWLVNTKCSLFTFWIQREIATAKMVWMELVAFQTKP